MKPEEVTNYRELASDYAKELRDVKAPKDFSAFLYKWRYWLDEETKKLLSTDWKWMKPLLDDCRDEKAIPEEKHQPAMALAMPERIFRVSMVAVKFHVPWGAAYKRLRQEKLIDW